MWSTLQYRVQDSHSQAHLIPGRGVHAGLTRSGVSFRRDRRSDVILLQMHLHNHLDWYNTQKTPLISTYHSREVAYAEALRRRRSGKKDVIIICIDVTRARETVHYRNMRKLARKCEVKIPYRAWHNSQFEYVFLHQIPHSVITKVIKLRQLNKSEDRSQKYGSDR